MRYTSLVRQTAILLLAMTISAVAYSSESGGPASCEIQGDRMAVVLQAGTYDLTEGTDGEQITMEGFCDLAVPGRPRLPLKRFLIGLPPGARALSVQVLRTNTVELPGRHRIEPYPRIFPLPDMPDFDRALNRMEEEWQAEYRAAYATDAPYPDQPAWLAGAGTFHRVAYATVAFCPFTYHAESGRLAYHSDVEFLITFETPLARVPESPVMSRARHNGHRDEKASGLFVNYDSIADLYSTEGLGAQSPRETYDYIILTTGGLVGAVAASELPAWKTALGHTVRTVLITDPEISNQPGVDLAEQIRTFLRSYYAMWGIEYVLIVGDYATVPMRICYPDPTFHVYDPSNPGLVAPGTPTDYYYADLSYADDVSWDSDGDGYHGEYGEDNPDFLAEVAVGRIPVNDSARITYALDKLVAFDQNTGTWKANVLHGAAILFFENQNYSDYPFIDGATLLDSIETGLMSGFSITHFSEQTGIVTSPFPWPQITEAAFTGEWGRGKYGVVNWSGHGWSDGVYRTVWGWDDGDGVPESSNGEMQSYRFIGTGASNLDDDHPSIVFAMSCNVGYPDPNPYGNLGIDLLTLPNWGPSAGIVSASRPAAISGDWKSNGGGSEQICYEFNRYMIVEDEGVGDALYDGKFHATINYGWDYLYEYMNLYNFNLYGDPALRLVGQVVEPALSAELIGGEVVLTWTPVATAQAYWIYGASNDPGFSPGFAPGYAHRQAVLPSGTTTWSSPNGVGDTASNWTYLVIAVDAAETVLATSNRAGEMDYDGNIP